MLCSEHGSCFIRFAEESSFRFNKDLFKIPLFLFRFADFEAFWKQMSPKKEEEQEEYMNQSMLKFVLTG